MARWLVRLLCILLIFNTLQELMKQPESGSIYASWARFGSIAGILFVLAFIGSSVPGEILNAPTTLGTLLGFACGLLLLVFNLITFPTPPDSAGLVDVGPIMGVWYLVISVQMLRSVRWIREREANTSE
jgi:hypothetical protein